MDEFRMISDTIWERNKNDLQAKHKLGRMNKSYLCLLSFKMLINGLNKPQKEYAYYA